MEHQTKNEECSIINYIVEVRAILKEYNNQKKRCANSTKGIE